MNLGFELPISRFLKPWKHRNQEQLLAFLFSHGHNIYGGGEAPLDTCQIDRRVSKKERWRLIFIKGAKCFEAKKAINHELKVHGYGGGKKDEEDDDSVWVSMCFEMNEGEEEKIRESWYL